MAATLDDQGKPRGSAPAKTAGRKPGKPNKRTMTIAAMVRHALDLEGGVDYLRRVARDQPRLFVPLLARVMPVEAIVQAANVQFVIQSYNVEAQPVPGVLASPVEAHIANALPHPAQIIEQATETALVKTILRASDDEDDEAEDSQDIIDGDFDGLDALDRF